MHVCQPLILLRHRYIAQDFVGSPIIYEKLGCMISRPIFRQDVMHFVKLFLLVKTGDRMSPRYLLCN